MNSRTLSPLTPLGAFVWLATTACVSQGQYDAKVAELQRTQTELERQRQAHAGEELESTELAARLERAQAALRSAEQASAELLGQLDDREATSSELQAQLDEQKRLLGEFEALAEAYGAATPDELERALARLQERVRETERSLQQAANELERERRISGKLQALIDAGKLRVRRRSGRLVIELPGDIHFASGSPKLTETGKSTLKELAAVLEAETDRLFVVEGHTDNVPITVSGFRSNFHLGSARAESARDLLVESGLDGPRVAIASWAELLPACPEVDDTECRRRNRRVEVVLLPRFE
jgi:chemotaxis protein MotB